MSRGEQAGAARQQVLDTEHRCDYVQVPFLLLEDVARGRLHPTALTLWLYYKRRAWEMHGADPPTESLRDTEERSGLSRGCILTQRKALATQRWITIERDGEGRAQTVIVKLLDRWRENCHGHAPTAVQNLDKPRSFVQKPDDSVQNLANSGRNLDKAELESDLKSKELRVKQQHARGDDADPGAGQPGLPRFQAQVLPVGPEDLVSAVYRGGRRDRSQLTESMDRRELAIARQLVFAGAAPLEAEAWARDVADDPRRRAAIDMRAYERERADWLARRGAGAREGPRLVDRTGQPPSWDRPIAVGAEA